MDSTALTEHVARAFASSIVDRLREYITIPNESPLFDAEWATHGHMDRAVDLVAAWCRVQPIEGLRVEVCRLPGRTPLLFCEIPAFRPARAQEPERCVLLYGHLDKQPPMTGWSDGLGPWTPVLRGERLYGRGAADDGYAAFASLTALAALQAQGVSHGRCVVVIEATEESGSTDLPAYIEALAGRIGTPGLVVCLDSGCGNYDQLWLTTSLRGALIGTLSIDVLTEGVHSGDASGIVPSTFRIARQLLARIDDEATGRVRVAGCEVAVPAERLAQARATAAVLGDEVWNKFPWTAGARPVAPDALELILNRTWRAALSVTGADGLPATASAGNVLRPTTKLKLSLRLPPTADAAAVSATLKTELERDPPYGARVSYDGMGMPGWSAPPLEPWLDEALARASRTHFGRAAVAMGEGGSIPFMGMLGERFPAAQFLITGVLGPQSNAHGPNEFLDLPTARRVTACVAEVLAAEHRH